MRHIAQSPTAGDVLAGDVLAGRVPISRDTVKSRGTRLSTLGDARLPRDTLAYRETRSPTARHARLPRETLAYRGTRSPTAVHARLPRYTLAYRGTRLPTAGHATITGHNTVCVCSCHGLWGFKENYYFEVWCQNMTSNVIKAWLLQCLIQHMFLILIAIFQSVIFYDTIFICQNRMSVNFDDYLFFKCTFC